PTLLPPSVPASSDDDATVVAAGDGQVGSEAARTTVVRSGPPTAVFDGLEMFDREAGSGDRAVAAPTRRSRRWPWLVLVLLLLVGTGAFAYVQALPATALVPNVDNYTRADAEDELRRVQAENDLSWEVVVDESFSEAVAEGLVISQTPTPGTVLEDGMTVTLVVSKGLPFVAVPDLSELSVEEAEATLAKAGLTLGDVSEANDEKTEAGLVLDWSSGGEARPAELRKGSEVDVVVSAGPAPRTVPNLAGKTAEQARAELERIGLRAEVVERFSSSVDKGLVIGTDPGAGAGVARGRSVTVVVSKGRDLVVVPDLKGRTFEEFKEALEDAGLIPGDVAGNSRGDPAASDPEPGDRVERGTPVDIFLRRR
ncbi:MAG: PASTA domain-containing protein, partial [Actinomycetota bacterium]|nr:PASTA domain-containing protein [Actinomycetota bacterium]